MRGEDRTPGRGLVRIALTEGEEGQFALLDVDGVLLGRSLMSSMMPFRARLRIYGTEFW